ncbi:hypothetical protein F5X97DRAFT_344065 [Nemania serpens]|nr:hypothetical protein F5X97DRAFT_344065 [Nemania serpens]
MASNKKPEESVARGGGFSGTDKQDILSSTAWARANHKGGILTADEFEKTESGLRAADEEYRGQIIGKEVAGKLRIGRRHNELREIESHLLTFLQATAECAEGEIDHLRVRARGRALPFRETHHISGRIVALAEKSGAPMNELLMYEQLRSADARFERDIAESFRLRPQHRDALRAPTDFGPGDHVEYLRNK